MKNVRTKTITLISFVLFLILNSVFLISYYNFYLTDKLSHDIIEAKNQNLNSLHEIYINIYGNNLNKTVDILKDYVGKKGGYVSLKTIDGYTIYTNKKDINKLFSSTIVIYVENMQYELSYSKIMITPGLKLVRNLVFYEIIIISLIVIISYLISAKKLIEPMETITKDINNYKYGKRPFKRKMTKEMQQIQNTFVDMVDNIEIKKEYQNQIIASISHDIKTPLTSVIGYADRLKNNSLSEDKKLKYIDKIYNKAVLMKEILEEFDDYQSCNIKETMKFENKKVKDLSDNIRKDFEEELKDKNITLNINNNCGDYSISIDEIKIKRVFSNIITNSVNHFKDKKGVIEINFSLIKDKVRIEIKDNAGGISDEKAIKKIFEPLYTTDPSRKISGLGLSICKQIISAHDGMIYARNNDIGGLSIIFKLPVI